AVLAMGGDALRVGAVGQREAPVEHAVAAFDAREVLALVLFHADALALDGEQALVHLDLDVLRVDAGDVGVQDEAVRLLLDVDARRPLAGDHGRFVGAVVAKQAAFEQAFEELPHGILGAGPSAPAAADLAHLRSPRSAGT